MGKIINIDHQTYLEVLNDLLQLARATRPHEDDNVKQLQAAHVAVAPSITSTEQIKKWQHLRKH